MDAERPPSEPAPADDPALDPALAGGGDEEAPAPVPAVVAVVIARDDAPHLETCLQALGASDYPDLTVLVIAATEVDLTPRVAAAMSGAFVRSVPPGGVATAANEALATVAGAPFLLFVHSDTVCDPRAVRLLVEEAYRSNAAIVGPKVVDVERAEILREVGWSVDRFGTPHSEIERDELDQEQHDAVRDVFFVTDVCMLVRADLFGELEGFDADCDPGARELDLCWRARLAAARVIVAPEARVAHYEADGPEEQDRKLAARHRVRALLTNTSGVRLLWIAPVAFVVHCLEAALFLVRRQPKRAGELLSAWTWNLGRLSSLATARRRAQGARVVPDREIHALQFRGSVRVSAYVTTSLHAEDRVRTWSQRGRSVAETANTKFRSARGLVLVAFLVLVVIGARDLFLGRTAAIGQLAPWPGVGDLWRAFTSEWRYADLGAHAPAPPQLVLAALLRVVSLGNGGFARTLVVVGAVPLGAFGAHRVGRRVAGPGWPSATVAVVYGIVPLARNAVVAGRMGALVFFALAPFVLLAIAQLGGLVPSRRPAARVAIGGALALAVATAFWPLAIVFPLVVAFGWLAAAPLTGDSLSRVFKIARGSAMMFGLALVALFPWPLAVLDGGDRMGALGIVFAPIESVGALTRLVTGPNGGGIGSWAFVVTGLAVTLIATGERARWCMRLWGVVVVVWMLTLLPNWFDTASPAVEAMLVPVALAFALIAGIGVATFLEEVRRHGLGWRQALSVVAAAAVGLAALGFVGDAAGGRWHQPSGDWNETLSWTRLQRDRGPFRILWLGRPDVVPGSPHRSGADAFALTNDGPGDLVDQLPPPGGAGTAAITDAVARLRRVATTRFGRLVSPMDVRYVAVPVRPDPGPGGATVVERDLVGALSQQLDLQQVDVVQGLQLYENTAWVPVATARRGGSYVWSQQYSASWHGERAGRTLDHRRAFGWTNRFVTGSETGPVSVTFERQWWRWPLVLFEALIVAALVRRARRRRRRDRLVRTELHATEASA
ncbi:MAG: glycosyltransferase [Acidimicrobiia bacterium]